MKHDVIFTKEKESVQASSVEELLRESGYVGFQARTKSRYFLWGGDVGLNSMGCIAGIRPDGYWPNPWPDSGQFYVFDTKKELFNWMAEEETE